MNCFTSSTASRLIVFWISGRIVQHRPKRLVLRKRSFGSNLPSAGGDPQRWAFRFMPWIFRRSTTANGFRRDVCRMTWIPGNWKPYPRPLRCWRPRFSNLSAECKQALPKGQAAFDSMLCEYIGPVSEDKLRSFELRFHNLQSLYDTYVSTTETEGIDPEIPVLRGHISVVLHLLRTARDFAHYIERHAGPYHVHLPPGRANGWSSRKSCWA